MKMKEQVQHMMAAVVGVLLLMAGTEGATRKPQPKATGDQGPTYRCKGNTEGYCAEALGSGYGTAYVGPRKLTKGTFNCASSDPVFSGQCCPHGAVKTKDPNAAETVPPAQTAKCVAAAKLPKT